MFEVGVDKAWMIFVDYGTVALAMLSIMKFPVLKFDANKAFLISNCCGLALLLRWGTVLSR